MGASRGHSQARGRDQCTGQPRQAHSCAVRIVGSLHTDNAGEFLSKEFREFLDTELIDSSTCPPHVHQLNGIAERAIRSVMENTRSHLVASNAPIGFWPYALQHSIAILNRATGPPHSESSSYEFLLGKAPKILPIQPFGCRSVAVTPRASYSKTMIQPRAKGPTQPARDACLVTV